MRSHVVALALAALAVLPARAEEDDAGRAARWQDLSHAVFGDRKVEEAGTAVTLEAPDRALDAALVPLTVTVTAPDVKALYLVIDQNPSPLAGVFHFGPAADPRALKTRVRVDAYTLIHAVAETKDGRLLATARFVKAAGGCSAPAGGDQQLAMQRLGQMKLKPAALAAPGTAALQLLVSHPNYNGMQVDQVTHYYTPARFIQDIKVSAGGQLVFDLESDISLSADPAITFGLAPQAAGPVTVELRDSANAVFKQSFDLPAKAS